jgi:hypothetical protein
MTTPMSPRDPDAILAAWLEEGPAQLPETTRRAIAVDLRTTRQNRRVLDVPWRLNTMNPFARLAAVVAVIAALAFAGALYLVKPSQPAVGGPSPTPTPQAPATSGAAESGSGNAHYEITGPDAASGDATFASSVNDTSSDAYQQSVVFEDGSLVIRIKFPPPGCNALGTAPCGTIDISTATGSLRDIGWRASPLPAGPSCTWDIPSLTANGGSGTVECTNAINQAHPATPNTVTITFTYRDPSG